MRESLLFKELRFELPNLLTCLFSTVDFISYAPGPGAIVDKDLERIFIPKENLGAPLSNFLPERYEPGPGFFSDEESAVCTRILFENLGPWPIEDLRSYAPGPNPDLLLDRFVREDFPNDYFKLASLRDF